LMEWCESGPVVCVLSGDAGVGKTRLTLELAEFLLPEWTVGRLKQGAEREAVSRLVAAPGRTLVVVENVGTRPNLAEFLHQAYTADPGRLRIILVMRNASWLDAVKRTIPTESKAVLDDALTCHLTPFGGVDDLRRWYD
jgi:hypothetical protein